MNTTAKDTGIDSSAGLALPGEMSESKPESEVQMAASRKVMARRRRALRELAK